jgi:hypothetical protein
VVSVEATAATIYGLILRDSRPAINVQVILRCGDAEAAKAVTDDHGNYRLTAGRTGPCKLFANGASGDVVLYTEPTRYDFEIRGNTLARR